MSIWAFPFVVLVLSNHTEETLEMYEMGWARIIDEESRNFVFSAMPDAPVIADAPPRERRLRRRTATVLHWFAGQLQGGVNSPAGNSIAKEGLCAT